MIYYYSSGIFQQQPVIHALLFIANPSSSPNII